MAQRIGGRSSPDVPLQHEQDSVGVTDTTRRTFASFGYEWNAFGDLREEDQGFWRRISDGLPTAELASLRGLDAGCGKGRYTRHLAPHLASLVALDGSDAVLAASRNLAGMPNVAVVKADLREPPFGEASFSLIMSLGVLHHLEEPEEGFRRLVDLLAPGGIIFVYLYSAADGLSLRSVGLLAATALRKVTVRLPHRLLRWLSLPLAALLTALFVVPGAVGERTGIQFLRHLPLATYRGKPLRSLWLDTFDRLSAPVEHRYRWPELAGWFGRAGLTVTSVREDAGWYVVARKPGTDHGG